MKSRNIRVVAFLTTLTILLGCCTFGSASATHINSIGVTPSTNIVTIVKEDIPSYHSNDRRSTWTNPNPMFKLSGSSYVPNPYFNYSYTPSDYNSTSTSWGN